MDEHREEIIHEKPCREMLWFQELVQQDQNGYTVNKTKVRQILEYILRRMKNE